MTNPNIFASDTRLVVATADRSDPELDGAVRQLLRLLRDELKMDVVFVAEFVDGYRVFRRIDAAAEQQVIQEGDSHLLEQSYCQRMVDGRLPAIVPDVTARAEFAELPNYDFPIGAYIGVPVRLQDGSTYGTLCGFSFSPKESLGPRDLRRMEMSAELTGRLIDEMRGQLGAPYFF